MNKTIDFFSLLACCVIATLPFEVPTRDETSDLSATRTLSVLPLIADPSNFSIPLPFLIDHYSQIWLLDKLRKRTHALSCRLWRPMSNSGYERDFLLPERSVQRGACFDQL
ncbi:uncharacterized protein UTRI_06531 [Ustilago trichophora]|uniref:Uncharacterized protein n=1 Tax=Ustilago trichophora TaxID=86804 RepID=A0A5C3EPK9_9BASI|nr:uncharacterized protein UTRI_06531 [Ustilago trichophora]